MDHSRTSLPTLASPGAVATFYSYDSAAMRSIALSNLAVLLAARENASVPVLMVDWDTEAPTLHHVFDQRDEHVGLLELFEACRDYLQALARPAAAPDDTALARQVLDAVDWQRYVQRIDQGRALYLMRAGCFDADYGRRASAMDWDGLFATCPALFRTFAATLASHFRHVLVDARSGRSATVSICTTLVPDQLVTLFTPNARSLEGLEGVVTRAMDYRRSHEEEQRPLLLYPLPCAMDSTDSARRCEWRFGDAEHGLMGYQAVLERLMRHCYGVSALSLSSYLDEVQLQQSREVASGVGLVVHGGAGGDRFSLGRSLSALLEWWGEGFFPWQSRPEVALLRDVNILRADARAGQATALPLARQLLALGALHRQQGNVQQAIEYTGEACALRAAALGDGHGDTLAARTRLAQLQCDAGVPETAQALLEPLLPLLDAALGGDHPHTLEAQAALASALAMQSQFDGALALEQALGASCERLLGASHLTTLESVARQADILSRQGKLSQARQALDRVLDGRKRQLGLEHASTLDCKQQIALLLCTSGELQMARELQERVLAARRRHAGPNHPDTFGALQALAAILHEQGDVEQPDLLSSTNVSGRGGGESAGGAPGEQAGHAMERRLGEVESLIEQGSLDHARDLADSLRKPLLRRGVGVRLRIRGMAVLTRIYKIQHDHAALAALHEAEARSLDDPLSEMQAANP
jgi:tetratricopeptide (TPR) repeat protein